MNRQLFVACTLFAVLVSGVFVLRRTPSPGAGRPNVIIYLVDTLRADHLGLYGYERQTSPLLDAWATGGVIFDRAYSPSSWTRPSTVSLLSGLDPISHRVEDRLDVIPGDVRLLSEYLKSSGYATFAAVTNPNVLPEWGFDRGFDAYDDLDSVGSGTRADTVSDYVTGKMDELARSQPFFLYLHLIDPHAPYDPPAPFDERFPRSPALPAKQSIGRYDGEIAFVDSQFGRVLDSLTEHGLDGDTMVIFVADHGEELLDHGLFGHGVNLFEAVVRIPLVIRFPSGAHAGARVGAPVSLIDVVPTVMSTLGQSAPPDVDGRDLTELLDGNERRWPDRPLFLSLRTTGQRSHLVRGVVSGPQKYLRRSRPVASEALFDLDRDAKETTNLASQRTASRTRIGATLDAHLAKKSRGIHLRIVNDLAREPVGCEAVLHTTGRFVDASEIRLEAGDRFELSADGRTLQLHCRLENRIHPTGVPEIWLADEDGLVFQVEPPDASIVVQHLGLADGRALPLAAGPRRELETLPFSFDATLAAWSVRDVSELLGDEGTNPERATASAYLAVISAPVANAGISRELRDRLDALGYTSGAAEVR